jgi:L-asparaginase type I
MTTTGKPKVCLIYTGGTIGMQEVDGVLTPPNNPNDFLSIAPELNDFLTLRFEPLLNKDSTNMSPSDWEKMAQQIYDLRHDSFDGFVVAHGTDTMHFSSSALSFALGPSLNFPVVFTGAQTIPSVSHGDARINLVRACRVALTELAEVVVSFGEFVFRGSRVQKKDERRFDAFESPGYFPIGYITQDIVLHPNARRKDPSRPRLDDSEFQPHFRNGVLQVMLIPGLEPELVLPSIESPLCTGVILQSFGLGNVPDAAPFSFESVIKHAVNDLNKPVIITSQFPAGSTIGSDYAPGRKAVAAGAIPTGNMTSAAAGVKFRWVLASIELAIARGDLKETDRIPAVRERMKKPYVREMD